MTTAATRNPFLGGPAPSCPHKHARYPERQPDIFVALTGNEHRATACDITRGIIADPTLDDWAKSERYHVLFLERLREQQKSATDPREVASLKSMDRIVSLNLHSLKNLYRRVRDILALRGEEA
jgi:hypothetical protein